jgi:hypothetical protein
MSSRHLQNGRHLFLGSAFSRGQHGFKLKAYSLLPWTLSSSAATNSLSSSLSLNPGLPSSILPCNDVRITYHKSQTENTLSQSRTSMRGTIVESLGSCDSTIKGLDVLVISV